MVKSKWEYILFLLSLFYFAGWLRGSISFISYDMVFLLPSLMILLFVSYISLYLFRLRVFLLSSEIGAEFLNSLVLSKIKLSIVVFVGSWLVAELIPLIAYPFAYIMGVIFSMKAFSMRKRIDVIAVERLFFSSGVDRKRIIAWQIFSGVPAYFYSEARLLSMRRDNEDDLYEGEWGNTQGHICHNLSDGIHPVKGRHLSVSHHMSDNIVHNVGCNMNDDMLSPVSVNPATGLFMTGAGVDSGGGFFGVSDMTNTALSYSSYDVYDSNNDFLSCHNASDNVYSGSIPEMNHYDDIFNR